MFQRINGGKKDETKFQKALRRFGMPLLAQSADAALNETGRFLLAYSRQGDSLALEQAEESAAALLATIREMRERTSGR